MFAEIHIAVRRLAKSPLFTATALGTLALCVGANLTIFSVVDAVLIRSLPVPRADRLVRLYYVYPKLPSATPGASLTNYYERRGRIPALASISEIDQTTTVLGESGATSIENLGRVTPEFFTTLGVAPFMGRAFTDADMTYQTDHVAILSFEYWKSVYDSDPGVLGKHIRMDGDDKTIVGVLPPRFRFLSFQAPVYMPLSSEEDERSVNARHSIGKIQIGRIADGATLADVQAQVDARDAVLAPEFPEAKLVEEAGTHTVVAPLQADYVASVRPMLLLLQAAALFLLLIGCVNLVNLLLVRATGRSREMAIRRALGAGKRQVIKEVITETMMLSLAGALLGLWLGEAGIRLIGRLGVSQLPLGSEAVFNGRLAVAAVLGAFAIGACVAVPIAWFNLHSGLSAALKSEARGTASSATLRLRRAFIVAQIALAFTLLTGAGLLGMSLRRAMAVPPGFQPDHVITGQFNLTWHNYPQLDTFHKFFDRLFQGTAELPGISAIGASSMLPLSGNVDGDVMTVRDYVPTRGDNGLLVHDAITVAGDYFAAMGIPLIGGRFLKPADARTTQLTCVVDEAFARHYWPGGSAIGKEVYMGTRPPPDAKYYRIVGVVGSVKQTGLTEKQGRGAVYVPFSRNYTRNYVLVARTSLAPEAVANLLARKVREADSDVPLTNLRTMDVRVSDSLSTRRTPALMAGVFAATALFLATFGLYGVMAYAVAQRTQEFGVRIALGAQNLDLLRLVLIEGVKLVVLGLGVGIALSLVLTRFMASLLYGVTSDDPLAIAGVATAIALVVSLACYLPARRATKIDPVVALRAE
ncbi:MAG: ABC transporter permease [Opitutaceae bacterium]